MAEIAQIASYCMKLCEGVHESVWKHHHWIFQVMYVHFDTQHVEIGSKMAELAQIAWKLREIVWNCVNTRVKLFESITNEFLSSSTCILIPNM